MNVRKLMPGGRPRPASEPSPLPRTNRNSTGWISEVTARRRSVRNLIHSRRQTMPAARRSWRRPRWGTATRMTVERSAGAGAAGSVVVVAIGHRLPARKRWTMARLASALLASVSRMVRPV